MKKFFEKKTISSFEKVFLLNGRENMQVIVGCLVNQLFIDCWGKIIDFIQ